MANKQFFVLGIGGTGMRCIEALLHLAAMGMFDETDIHLLALDTDKNNGNFARLKELKDTYRKAKGSKQPLSNAFFSANIHYYQFSPNYDGASANNFRALYRYSNVNYDNKPEAQLADLMFTSDVQEFHLEHGYRAQTHLGSMLMYHSIIEAAESKEITNGESIKDFLSELGKVCQSGQHPRVFVLGSVFGGTGASSIPIIPQAIAKAAAIITNGTDILQSAYFGSTLLTAYFSFQDPGKDQTAQQKVIAMSSRLALNSQIAMMFYDEDTTVKQTYQHFYMMGTDNQQFETKPLHATNQTITGGSNQCNDSHYIELLAAAAAWDFFHTPENELENLKFQAQQTNYLYRAVSDINKLEFNDFIGGADAKDFQKRFGLLIAFAILCNGEDNFVESARDQFYKDSIQQEQVDALKKYFELFFVSIRDNEKVLKPGWLMQLHNSAGGADAFLFNAQLFAISNIADNAQLAKKLASIKWNENIYRKDGSGKDHRFSVPFLSTKFDKFKKTFLTMTDDANITAKNEQLYKRIFDTLASLYNF